MRIRADRCRPPDFFGDPSEALSIGVGSINAKFVYEVFVSQVLKFETAQNYF
jgi:hypothetical protein